MKKVKIMKKVLLAATAIAFTGITALSAKVQGTSSEIKTLAVQDTIKQDSTSKTQSISTVSQDSTTTKKDSTDKKQ